MHTVKSARLLLPGEHADPTIMFIFGCQRSGTSIMNRVLARAWNTYVFREKSKLTTDDPIEGLRLNDLPKAQATIGRVRQDLATAKILVESQRMPELLDAFPTSKALWMFRDYRSAAASSVKNFGKSVGYDDLRPIADGDPNNWRSEGASPVVRETVSRLFSEKLEPVEAAALFWWARNQLILEAEFPEPDRVAMLRYRDFVSAPDETMQGLYTWLGVKHPGERMTRDVHVSSVERGKSIDVRPEIGDLCEETWEALIAKTATMQCCTPEPSSAQER